MDDNFKIAQRLRELRKSCGYSQDYVAIKLNTNITRISLIENSKTTVDALEILRFSRLYNVDVREILLDRDNFESCYHLSETQDILDSFKKLDTILKENNSVMLKKWFLSIHNELKDIMEEVKFLNSTVK